MNESAKFAILKRLFDNTDISELQKHLVIETDRGYELFGEYVIALNEGKYVITKNRTDLYKEFFNLKNAIVWATLDYRNSISNANRVDELDMLIEGLTASINMHQEYYNKSKDADRKLIYFTKLQESRLKKRSLQHEIGRYINETKRWQESQFKKAAK